MAQVLLYYNFTPIEDVDRLLEEHRVFCRNRGIKGRIYLSEEGINGTAAGEREMMEAYKRYIWNIPDLEQTEFKTDEADRIPFARLVVKRRPEIVSMKLDAPLDPPSEGGRHLDPHEWRQVLESGEDYVLIDVRNTYETRIGHFEGAIRPQVDHFYEFPQWLEQAGIEKDRKVLMYCTGGIRCEKFSALMKKKGYRDVNQLSGGILNYAKQEQGRHFRGKCFVFDDRLVVPVNEEQEEPISHCEITGEPCDKYINCANMHCNRLFICSPEGARKMKGCCSEACMQSPYRRPFDIDSAYKPFRKWYHYFDR